MNVAELYGQKTRVRVLGVLALENSFLFVNHAGLNAENVFWHFPGGGIDANETIKNALIREFREETGLEIEILNYLGIREYVKAPLHAVELYFSVKIISGQLMVGHDPELNIIKDVAYLGKDELLKIPENQRSSSIFDFI